MPAPTTKAPEKAVAIDILQVAQAEATYRIIGVTPLIQERMSQKNKQDLLFPRGRMNAVDKATTLKHDPLAEFRASCYIADELETHLAMPATAMKDAIRTAALDLTGVSKSQIGRLTYLVGDQIPIWGVPEVFMAVTRSADMNKTPDVRTRPIIPRWATTITVRFIMPNLTAEGISRLVAAAGMTVGIGGWRQEKGSGNYGLFQVVTADQEEAFDAIIRSGGMEAQQAALANPVAYNDETAELLSWYADEVVQRRKRGQLAPDVAAAAD